MTKDKQTVDDFYSGDSLRLNYIVYNDDDEQNRKDIRSASVDWVLAPKQGAAALVSKSVSGGGVTITDGINGELEVELDPSDTDALGGEYYHELQVTDAQGNVSTVASGNLIIQADTA